MNKFNPSDVSIHYTDAQIDDINAMFQAEEEHDEAIMFDGDFIKTHETLNQAKRKVTENTQKTVQAFKSISFRKYKELLAEKPRPALTPTEIEAIDSVLIDSKTGARGITLGNLIYIVGESGAGKSEFTIRLMSIISNQVERVDINGEKVYKKVAHFNFEMGQYKVEDKLNDHGVNEDSYYIYEGSHDIDSVKDEIMALYVKGFKHFIIDSKFKLTKKGLNKLDTASLIGAEFQEMARSLGINIYIIDQMNSENTSGSDRNLAQKHGNDATYEADYIFYLLMIPELDEKGKPLKDESGILQYREDSRMLIIKKDRSTEKNGARIILQKRDIVPHWDGLTVNGNSYGATKTYTYQDSNSIPIQHEDKDGNIDRKSTLDLPFI